MVTLSSGESATLSGGALFILNFYGSLLEEAPKKVPPNGINARPLSRLYKRMPVLPPEFHDLHKNARCTYKSQMPRFVFRLPEKYQQQFEQISNLKNIPF
jgi:hypothetical protein